MIHRRKPVRSSKPPTIDHAAVARDTARIMRIRAAAAIERELAEPYQGPFVFTPSPAPPPPNIAPPTKHERWTLIGGSAAAMAVLALTVSMPWWGTLAMAASGAAIGWTSVRRLASGRRLETAHLWARKPQEVFVADRDQWGNKTGFGMTINVLTGAVVACGPCDYTHAPAPYAHPVRMRGSKTDSIGESIRAVASAGLSTEEAAYKLRDILEKMP